jgi:RNA polymerase sigma-70 factor (ECF subfamily)
VNGSPSALMIREGATVGVLMLDLSPDGRTVAAIYAVTNPQKLTTLH